MSTARQRANLAATKMALEARTSRDGTVRFPELGVNVKDGNVYDASSFRSRLLGPLAGACAGVKDIKGYDVGSFAWEAVVGSPARVGTLFVELANGQRKLQPLRNGSRQQLKEVDKAIALFNWMVDNS
jgi:hypothetical protein